jgi:hypothetical protein
MADYSLADLQGAFEGALKSVFGGNSSKNSGAASGAGTAASGAGQSVPAKLFDSLGELAKAGAPVASAFIAIGADGKEAATVFKTFATMAPGVGKSLGGFVETLEQGREAIALSGKQGIGNNNILEFAAQAKAGGMTMSDNLKLLKDMGPSLTGIGLNAQDANQRFLKLSQDTIEKFGQSLATAQGGVDGLNAAAAIMATGTKKNLKDDVAGRLELAEASARLAEQIDLSARVTGKSRDVIESELKERLKSPDAILAMNLMSEQQRIAFKQTQASLNEMGPTIGNLAQNIASGARLTKENQSALNALGPAAGEFQRAIRMQQSATTDAQKQQAAVALEAAKAKINEYQSSERYARLALQGSGEVAEMQKKMISENQRRAGAQTTAEQTGQGYQQAQMTQAEIATRQQKGLIGTGERAGQVDEGQTGIRLLNAGQENFRKLAVAGATELVKFNDEFGRSPKLIKGAADAIEFMSGKLGQTSEQKNKELIVPVRDKIAEVAGFNTGAGPNNPVEYSDSSKLKNAKPGQSLTEGKREGGSKAATGNWFEDFGVGKIMELHKKEAVVPEAKLPEFMKDMMSQFSNAGATSQPKPADTDTVKQVNPFEQLTKQLESIKPKQADASPGTQANPFEQLTKQLQSIKMPEIKMPQAPTDMLGQLAGQFKGLTAGMSNIKQPEFPKLPMLPKAAEVAPRRTEAEKATEATARRQSDNPDTGNIQRKKMETAPEDIQTKILDALNQLNKTMGQMVAHTSDISETSSKTARYAGKAGSRTAA